MAPDPSKRPKKALSWTAYITTSVKDSFFQTIKMYESPPAAKLEDGREEDEETEKLKALEK